MEIKRRFVFHVLWLFVGASYLTGYTECTTIRHNITVVEGDTLVLKCPRTDASDIVEWRNSKGLTLFFNNSEGVKHPRAKVFTSNKDEVSLHVSNITPKDDRTYRCLVYGDYVKHRFDIKVVQIPKIEMTEHGRKKVIKCTAAANNRAPKLTWQIGEIEIDAVSNIWSDEKTKRKIAVSLLQVKPHIRKATVKCLANYKDLKVMNYVVIENNSVKSSTTSSYSTSRIELTTETMKTVTSAPVFSTTAHVKLSSDSESTEVFTTEETTSNSKRGEESSASTDISLTTYNINSSTSNSTEEILTRNGTDSGYGEKEPSKIQNRSSPLLILLVTCLIICLLIVVIFFMTRLRRAHLAWKKENEESDQSVESSKSKSNEEKHAQERRRPGFWNANFTVYKAEEPPQNTETSVATIHVISETQDTSSAAANNKPDTACVKETEL